jgi:hypothetical protein
MCCACAGAAKEAKSQTSVAAAIVRNKTATPQVAFYSGVWGDANAGRHAATTMAMRIGARCT